MSAVQNITTFTYQSDIGGSYDTSHMHFTENGMQNLCQHPMMEYSNEKYQKEQLQENIQLQQMQAEQSQTVPQQYQFQGPMPLQLKYSFHGAKCMCTSLSVNLNIILSKKLYICKMEIFEI